MPFSLASLVNTRKSTVLLRICKFPFPGINFLPVFSLLLNLDGGKIFVSLRRLSDEGCSYIRLDVRDTGIGIGQNDLEKIQDRFYRAEASGSSEGFGLGLSMVASIASLHDAKLEVKSSPGKGSLFSVSFPEYKAQT